MNKSDVKGKLKLPAHYNYSIEAHPHIIYIYIRRPIFDQLRIHLWDKKMGPILQCSTEEKQKMAKLYCLLQQNIPLHEKWHVK